MAWYLGLTDRTRRRSRGHDRTGIDYMVFPRTQTPKVPPFLVGRVQWDNWVLLRGIADPYIRTFEVSDVVNAVHLNHGAAFQSHERNGTETNKKVSKPKEAEKRKRGRKRKRRMVY
jgi:hypothetical protein